jgi:hypothetical protein
MRRRHALSIAIAAVLGALAVAALPALAGAKDDHGHHRGGHHAGEDHHHHGLRDRHENVGRISAFDAGSGQLTIARFGGGTISGLVTSSTEIKCEGPDDRFDDNSRFSRDSGNSGPGSGSGDDSSGSGSGDDNGSRGELEPGDDHGEAVEPGDDNGGQGELEPGDDRGGDNSGRGGDNRNDNDDRTCTTAELTVGTVVHEVDRETVNDVVRFDEIELGHSR